MLINKSIIWFRNDLRLHDNPALYEACKLGHIIPIYILDEENHYKDFSLGAASKIWLHHSLHSLNESLNKNLLIFKGKAKEILEKIFIDNKDIANIFWNKIYEPHLLKNDEVIQKFLENKNIAVKIFNASLLWNPKDIVKSDGLPYKIFTPFYNNGCLKQATSPREPLPLPSINYINIKHNGISIEKLSLLPKKNWHKNLIKNWHIGEAKARNRIKEFMSVGIKNYKEYRNYPAKDNVSKLSPNLHFGEISPNQLWYAAQAAGDNENIDQFCSELGWREFSYNLLYFNNELPQKNLQKKFDKFEWQNDKNLLAKWQIGKTGIPLVDAGMRELYQTGYMHNRIRMVVGSFLVKNLAIHWHYGAKWFWDCLFDADLANNSVNWQWVAGCGTDAAPYFRIFNPITQGQKFDPEGQYIKTFVPELRNLPLKYLFNPWEAPENVLKKADIILGKNYPFPIIDLKKSRIIALKKFDKLKFS